MAEGFPLMSLMLSLDQTCAGLSRWRVLLQVRPPFVLYVELELIEISVIELWYLKKKLFLAFGVKVGWRGIYLKLGWK
jgi:hypothetical protein